MLIILVLVIKVRLLYGLNEIGIRSKVTNGLVPINNGGSISKITGTPFELYCKADFQGFTNFNMCIWHWKQQESSGCIMVDDQVYGSCPGQMYRSDDDYCVIRLDNYQAYNHESEWKCALIVNAGDFEIQSNLSLSMVTMAGAQARIDKTSVDLKPGDSTFMTCSSSNKVYIPTNDENLFRWQINGQDNANNGRVVEENYDNCDDCQCKCNVHSIYEYTGQEGDSSIGCYAVQTDTFGDTLTSLANEIDVVIEQDSSISSLSVGAKIGIDFAMAIPLLI